MSPRDEALMLASIREYTAERRKPVARVVVEPALEPTPAEYAHDPLPQWRPKLTPAVRKSVLAAVATHYGLTVPQLLKATNQHHVCRPRQVAMALLRELSSAGYPELGRVFEHHHTTVLHAVRKVQRGADPKQHADYVALLAELRGERKAA